MPSMGEVLVGPLPSTLPQAPRMVWVMEVVSLLALWRLRWVAGSVVLVVLLLVEAGVLGSGCGWWWCCWWRWWLRC